MLSSCGPSSRLAPAAFPLSFRRRSAVRIRSAGKGFLPKPSLVNSITIFPGWQEGSRRCSEIFYVFAGRNLGKSPEWQRRPIAARFLWDILSIPYLPSRSGPRWKYPPAAGVSGKLISRPPPHEEKQIFPPTSSAPLRDAVGRNRRAPGSQSATGTASWRFLWEFRASRETSPPVTAHL